MEEPSQSDLEELSSLLTDYCETFGVELELVLSQPFVKLSALSVRPHGRLYAY